MRPLTIHEAAARGLTVTVDKGIHTFSNGTEWEYWAASNCYACRHFNADTAGGCAFETASILGMVSPELAALFGWTRSADYPDSWHAPDVCRFFRPRSDDSGDGPSMPDDSCDPSQLVLLADPTEDAAILTALTVEYAEAPHA